jgi:hypothetical protein
MRARYYLPAISRFINQDIVLGNIGSGNSMNRFAYANGDPINKDDPLGLAAQPLASPQITAQSIPVNLGFANQPSAGPQITGPFIPVGVPAPLDYCQQAPDPFDWTSIKATYSLGYHLPVAVLVEAGQSWNWSSDPNGDIHYDGSQIDLQGGGIADIGGQAGFQWGANPDVTVAVGAGKYLGISLGFTVNNKVPVSASFGLGLAVPTIPFSFSIPIANIQPSSITESGNQQHFGVYMIPSLDR